MQYYYPVITGIILQIDKGFRNILHKKRKELINYQLFYKKDKEKR